MTPDSSKMPDKKFYLHLIDGKAAYFSPRDGQLVYMEDSSYWRDEIGEQVLCSTLAEIREHEAITHRNRGKWGMDRLGRYGYAIVTLPQTPAAKPSPRKKARAIR